VIVFDDTESVEKVKVFNEGYDTRVNADNFGEFQLTYTRGDIHSPRLDNHEPLRLECEHLVECVAERTSPRTDGRNGLRVVKVIELAERSMRKNGTWEAF
jgi:predicted dehydrogenase